MDDVCGEWTVTLVLNYSPLSHLEWLSSSTAERKWIQEEATNGEPERFRVEVGGSESNSAARLLQQQKMNMWRGHTAVSNHLQHVALKQESVRPPVSLRGSGRLKWFCRVGSEFYWLTVLFLNPVRGYMHSSASEMEYKVLFWERELKRSFLWNKDGLEISNLKCKNCVYVPLPEPILDLDS